jgi:hypothetical protein
MATANATLVELDRRLAAVADQLAVLMVEQPWQWDRMCEKEAAEVVALLLAPIFGSHFGRTRRLPFSHLCTA